MTVYEPFSPFKIKQVFGFTRTSHNVLHVKTWRRLPVKPASTPHPLALLLSLDRCINIPISIFLFSYTVSLYIYFFVFICIIFQSFYLYISRYIFIFLFDFHFYSLLQLQLVPVISTRLYKLYCQATGQGQARAFILFGHQFGLKQVWISFSESNHGMIWDSNSFNQRQT